MRKFILAVVVVMTLLHVATAQTWPKPATTTKSIESNYQGTVPTWTVGAAPAWNTGTCSTQSVNCKIDTKGWWGCDGTPTALTNCTIELPRPSNVAGKNDGVSVRDLMYPGFNGTMWVNYNGWICPSTTNARPCGLPNLGYTTANAQTTDAYANKLLTYLDEMGFTGPVLEWYGVPFGSSTSSPLCSQKNCWMNIAMQKVVANIAAHPTQKYYIMMDNNSYATCDSSPSAANCGGDCTLVGTSTCTHDDKLAADLIAAFKPSGLAVTSGGALNPQYYTFNSKPVVASFGANCSSDWAGIKSVVLAKTGFDLQVMLSFRDGANPYTSCPTVAAGSWGHWIGHPNAHTCYNYTTFTTDSVNANACGTGEVCADQGTTSQKCQADKAAAQPTKWTELSVHNHFDNRSTPWGGFFGGANNVSLLPPKCGTSWLTSFSAIATKWSSSRQVNAVQVTTWDDYYENSAIENGIEDCWEFTDAHMTGNTLNWTVTKTDEDGAGPQTAADASFSAIDHFKVLVGGSAVTPADPTGNNLAVINANVSKGTCTTDACSYSLNLSTVGLNAGTHVLYVKMVPKAMMFTKLSSSVTFVNGNNPPVVAITSVSPSSGAVPVTVTAVFSAVDNDGTVSTATINWGDGTTDTVTGLTSKSHSYTTAGNYTIILSATDNAGATSTTSSSFTGSGGAAVNAHRGVVVSD